MPARSTSALTLTIATLLSVSGVAYAAVQSIDTDPTPQVVIPATSPSATPSSDADEDRGGDRGRRGSDDDPTHVATRDATDDATHDATDDPTHDADDDHGGDRRGSDDHGGEDRSGSNSGRG
jgi:hypothetical protein